jgi:hypothetical protein
MSEWHIVRPSPVHPWTVAIYEDSRLIAEVTDDVATQIETLKREHAEAQVNARAIGAAAAFWKARYDALVAERTETQAAIGAIVEKHAAAIAQARSSLDAAPFPRRLVRWPRRCLDGLRRIAVSWRETKETKWWCLRRVDSRTGIGPTRLPAPRDISRGQRGCDP